MTALGQSQARPEVRQVGEARAGRVQADRSCSGHVEVGGCCGKVGVRILARACKMEAYGIMWTMVQPMEAVFVVDSACVTDFHSTDMKPIVIVIKVASSFVRQAAFFLCFLK